MRTLLQAICGLVLMLPTGWAQAQDSTQKVRMTGAALEWSKEHGRLRQFMQDFPKGGDLHSHLRGAIYAESWLDWAAEDGLCADMSDTFHGPALKFKVGASCEESGWISAAAARANERSRRALINSMSTRSYVPTLNWSGHNDFFETFANIAAKPERLGDQLAEVAERAGHQNILYLELMETLVFPELFPLVADLEMTGDVQKDYQTLMDSPFGAKIPDLVASIEAQLRAAFDKKDKLLGCTEDETAKGCDVRINMIHQVIREFPPEMVYAQIILGWAAMEQVDSVVALNLVAPEDGYIALRDYSYHMRMIDFLYQNNGARNVTLHAGELTLGLVRPEKLRFHMREAIELGHAKRIGHGIDIAYEDRPEDLAQTMIDKGIMVEINLTSNDTILGIKGNEHPILMYRDLEVPYSLSTDDEGVSRIDLTHEYMRFFSEYDVPYQELKYVSRNALTYAFLEGGSLWDNAACTQAVEAWTEPSGTCAELINSSEKAQLQWELELRFRAFENRLRIPKRKRTSFN